MSPNYRLDQRRSRAQSMRMNTTARQGDMPRRMVSVRMDYDSVTQSFRPTDYVHEMGRETAASIVMENPRKVLPLFTDAARNEERAIWYGKTIGDTGNRHRTDIYTFAAWMRSCARVTLCNRAGVA